MRGVINDHFRLKRSNFRFNLNSYHSSAYSYNSMLVNIRNLQLQKYVEVLEAMQRFTETRNVMTQDELWVTEHHPVYTQGLNGKAENIIDPGDIPVIQTDRGGQSTYHGPGQLMVYVLFDLNRKKLGVRALVSALENSVIFTLGQYGINAYANAKAPGVYVEGKKIASVGLRVRRGCSYHGLSFNVSMNLSPFEGIHTCGYPELEVTQLSNLNCPVNPMEVSVPVIHRLLHLLDYDMHL